MSTILHPCIESQFIENAKVLKLKVATPQPQPKSMEFTRTSSIENRDEFNLQLKMKNLSSNTTTDHTIGGWNFLQAISSSSTPKETFLEKENNIYIHPLMSSKSSRLSEKSLQLCTENLGCETGSFFIDTNMQLLSLTSYSMEDEKNQEIKKEQEQEEEKQSKKKQMSSSYSIKKVKYSRELPPPPPLTTMSGEKSLQVKTHRENGRLIINAIEKPLKESCFLAERNEGCLKLCFLKDVFMKQMSCCFPIPIPSEENENENEAEDVKNENDKDEEAEDPGENEDYKEYNNNNNDIEIEEVENMGKEKFQRLVGGRCKECGNGTSNKKMCNWEPLWVATS